MQRLIEVATDHDDVKVSIIPDHVEVLIATSALINELYRLGYLNTHDLINLGKLAEDYQRKHQDD